MDGPLISVGAVKPATAAPPFFSLSDRLGRLRYFTYTAAAFVVLGFVLVAIYLLALLLPPQLGHLVSVASFILVKNVLIPMIVFVMSIRRLHDINANGWWALTVLFPFTTLALLAIPGNADENRFGPAPAVNSSGLKFFAVALPAALLGLYFFVVSINPPPQKKTPTTNGASKSLRNYSDQ